MAARTVGRPAVRRNWGTGTVTGSRPREPPDPHPGRHGRRRARFCAIRRHYTADRAADPDLPLSVLLTVRGRTREMGPTRAGAVRPVPNKSLRLDGSSMTTRNGRAAHIAPPRSLTFTAGRPARHVRWLEQRVVRRRGPTRDRSLPDTPPRGAAPRQRGSPVSARRTRLLTLLPKWH